MFPLLNKQAVSSRSQVSACLTPSWRLGWLTGSALLLLAAISSPVAAQTTLVDETFSSNNTFGWRVGNSSGNGGGVSIDPCLTAGNAATLPNSIQPCPAPNDSANPPSGALRLTQAVNNQATFVFYNNAIPSGGGLNISFDYFSYGGQPVVGSEADGITFFLFSGATPNAQASPGAFGGSLGYAQKQDNGLQSGLFNGVLGIGLDEFGNFANDLEGRGTGTTQVPNNCNGFPPAAGDRVTDSVTIRGAGSGQTGYCFLANSGSLVPNPSDPNGIDNPTVSATGPRDPALRTVNITLTPSNVLTVTINGAVVIGPINLSNFPNQTLPPTLKFGYASSTGGATNVHEIRNLKIITVGNVPTPDLAIQKKSNPSSFVAGDTGEYTLTVTNVGQGSTFGPVTVTDTLPPGFSLAAQQPSNPGWSCTEQPQGKVTCIFSGDPLSTNQQTDPAIDPTETQAVVLRVNVPKTLGTVTNTATVSAAGDNNPSNDTATLATSVTDILVASKTGTLIDANNNGVANPGEAIAYRVTMNNVSSAPATNTVFKDQLPDNTTYVLGTTKLNGTVVADAPDGTMPFSGNGSLVNSIGAPSGQIAPGQTAIIEFQVRINDPLPQGITTISNQGTVTAVEVVKPPILTDNPITVDIPDDPTVTPIDPIVPGEPPIVPGEPRLRLVKRITQVNTTPYSDVVNDPSDVNANPGLWPATLQPVGVFELGQQTPLKSGDEVEYTIYFLSDGSQDVKDVKLCDAIPAGTTFIGNSFGVGSGILLNQGGTQTPLTNVSDTDKGSFFSPLTPVTPPCADLNNPSGAIFLPLGEILNTAPNNAGFVRFRVKND